MTGQIQSLDLNTNEDGDLHWHEHCCTHIESELRASAMTNPVKPDVNATVPTISGEPPPSAALDQICYVQHICRQPWILESISVLVLKAPILVVWRIETSESVHEVDFEPESVGDQATSVGERAIPIPLKNGEATSILEREEGEYPKENGERRSNGVELHTKSNRSADGPDEVDNYQGNSRSPVKSIRRTPTASPPRISSRKSSRKSVSRSPVRVEKSVSRSPVRSYRRSVSRSSGRASSRRSPSRSPIRPLARNNRRSPSRSPVNGGRRARSPMSDHGRSSSRSATPNGSPKRIRRGRGFSQRYSYARRYRTPSQSPVRSHRYGVRGDRDRYYRRSPRRYRSPPRVRTPPRFVICLHLLDSNITLFIRKFSFDLFFNQEIL
ncbi:hypothetical protein RHSIM_Rhsim07G0156500 [Rhododendron simsii]|uniref:Uncharacterized protein n=1 Tax=Rhododendron simsii TaxID=118357 RepID=A0A834LI40_RHOSS|nr:hypothetical protein RHSIM_Rhsim07G0156500 [Rhododendron simsii]